MTDADRVAQARRLLTELGVSLAQLQAADQVTPRVPTVAEYLPRVEHAAGPGARRTYSSYWHRMATVWGDRQLDQIRATDIEALQRTAAASAVPRRNGRGGRHAGEHVIAAARAFFNRAIADGIIPVGASPAHQIAKPRRLPSGRRALTAPELADINAVARTSGNDTALDTLLLRLHTETACRRGGALALRLQDVNSEHGLIRLREKGETQRWQPVTVELAQHLICHATLRGASMPGDALLRYRNGRPPTTRRYDHRWTRLGQVLPLGSRPRHLHPLATPHHTHLGRTQLRLRHRPRLRRPHRQNRPRHHHLHQSRPPSRRHRTIRPHRPTPPARHQPRRPRHPKHGARLKC